MPHFCCLALGGKKAFDSVNLSDGSVALVALTKVVFGDKAPLALKSLICCVKRSEIEVDWQNIAPSFRALSLLWALQEISSSLYL